MSSTGVRDSSSTEKRVIKGLILNEAQFIQSLRVFANFSTLSGLGATGGDSNNSPLEASGNFFTKSGDFMLGQIGNSFDTIAATNIVNDILDVSKTSGVTFPVVILQGESPPTADDLVTIVQGEDVFPFQELVIRTRSSIITIKNSDNINTPDGNDLVLPVGSIIHLYFDTFLGEWVIDGGTPFFGSGGVSFPIDFPELNTGSPTVSTTIDFADSDRHFRAIELSDDLVIDLTNIPAAGALCTIYFTQDGVGGHVPTIPLLDNPDELSNIDTTANSTTVFTIQAAFSTVLGFTSGKSIFFGSSVSDWANFQAVNDVDFATFDGINMDRLLFTPDSGSFASVSDIGLVADSGGNLLRNVASTDGHFWQIAKVSLMSLTQVASNSVLSILAPDNGSIPKIQMFALDPSPTIGSDIGTLDFLAKNNAATNVVYAGLQAEIEGTTSGLEEGSLFLNARTGGSQTAFIVLNSGADGKISAFRNILMDIGRNIELGSNKIYTTTDANDTFISGDSSSVGIFVGSDVSSKANFGLTRLNLENDYFIQTQAIELRNIAGDLSSPINGTMWYNLTTEKFRGRENGVNVDIIGGASPLTTKGDIFGFSTVDARIPVGSDGQVLIANSVDALGVAWGDLSVIADGNTSATVIDAAPSFVVVLNGVQKFSISNTRIDYAQLDLFGVPKITMDDGAVSPTTISTLTASLTGLNLNIIDINDFYDIQLASNEIFHIDTLRTRIRTTDPNTTPVTLDLFRDDASPTALDLISLINFSGRDSAANSVTYGQIETLLVSPTNGSESSDMRFYTQDAGLLIDTLAIGGGGATIRHQTETGTDVASLSLLKVDSTSASLDNIGELEFRVLDTPTFTTYGRILGTILDTLDAGTIQFDVMADGSENVNAITISGAVATPNRTFVSFNTDARISSDLKFQVQNGFDDLKIFPALNQLGIVVQDNVSFSVGTLGTLATPISAVAPIDAADADAIFGDHDGAEGIFDLGSGTITRFFRQRDGNWASETGWTRDALT